MKKILLDLILIFLTPFMSLGLVYLVPLHFGLYYEYGKKDFLFALFPLILADLVYIIYSTLFYKRIRSREGFGQIKKFITSKKKLFFIIQVVDRIFVTLGIFVIPLFVLSLVLSLILVGLIILSELFRSDLPYDVLHFLRITGIVLSGCILYLPMYLSRYVIKKVFN